ncbi:peptidylprolyl isomerase [Pseudogemmobacter bohemicus]|uniref:peptidylprolyl isomerase n=1 Tax=Pseudogemmobacter bohemicus TaxID=2250708 RepID=UPI000DD4A4C0|nr:peptidylprolyl isomerase [Pseudogemmobacter bohemicus]
MALEKRMGAAVFWLATALTAPAWAEGETASTVVATVNGAEITLGQMIALRETLPPQYLTLEDETLFNGILDQLVQQEALAQSVTTQTVRDAANIANSTRGYLSGEVLGKVASAAVTDAALQKAWDERYANAAPMKEYRAAHILVETEAEAKELKAELDAGANFADLAKEASKDPGSGAEGGELGWFTTDRMVKPFGDAVAAATPGKVTDPVKSDFGWHLILVHESREKPAPQLDEVREELAAEVEESAVKAKIDDVTKAARIEKPGAGLDPALLKNSALID